LKFIGKNTEFIEIVDINQSNTNLLNASGESELSLVWFKSDDNIINIDTQDYIFNQNEMISLTEFHQIKVKTIHHATLIRWSRSFYCVIDHDSEVSCKGILYYGASSVPVMRPNIQSTDILNTVLKMLLIELQSRDNLQLEMLQMMLKRLLIICTRIYKEQHIKKQINPKSIDLIREYNYLIEQHFKSKHAVKEYADLLFKSPKTLSNLFKKNGNATPLQYIQNRIMLEAKRMLTYSDHSISEISHNLGFADLQAFSRFFSKKEGLSPQKFRTREVLPTN